MGSQAPPQGVRLSDRLRGATVSLRALLVVGGGLIVALLVAVGVVHRASEEAARARAQLEAHYAVLRDLAHDHDRALLEEEVALRQALARDRTLEPQRTTAGGAALNELLARLDAGDRRALDGALLAVADANREWRGVVEATARASAAAGDLEAIAARGRAVRDAEDRLLTALAERRTDALRRQQQRTDRLDALATAGLVAVGALALILLGLVVRHTARPLAGLAALAEAGQPFPDDTRALRVTEVRQLARALRQLQAQVRERQQSLEQSHSRAVSMNRFAEMVQQTEQRDEIRTAMATMIETTLTGGEVQILELDHHRSRLARTWPLAESDAEPPEVALDPSRCPALRRRRPVRADVPSTAACDCPVGAPAEGSYACIPMLSAGVATGLVNIRIDKPRAWTRNDVLGSQAYVNFASGALEALRMLQVTHDRAVRDGLTGAYNRRFLDEYLSKRLADSLRQEQPLSLMLLDLDHFKKLNDTFGHAVGDRALVEFAALVQSQIRGGDAFVRYGGEEFVLLLATTDLEGAKVVAERIRTMAERIVIDLPGADGGARPRITTSVGVATAPKHGSTPAELLAAADRAVYRAKALGRNRVETADPPLAS